MTQRFSFISFVAGVMLGVLLAGMWFLSDSIGSSPFSSTPPLSKTGEQKTPESGAVSVASQPSGENVAIESVTVPPPGVWVAVREANGTDLGNVLGAERVVGPHGNVSVSLLRPTEPNRSYAVELYRDDNNGTFDPAVNSVYVDFDTGARVVAFFSTTE
ncbi:MAG: hypothetical protein PHV99_00665 [Candidatus Pacebacteria bacterium]|nr:hypothetical protein [Candidatus Paceibacterota bacterium]